jgi:hypothetical protein
MSPSTQSSQASPGKEQKVRFVPATSEGASGSRAPNSNMDSSKNNTPSATVWYSSKDSDSKPPQDSAARNVPTRGASPGGNTQANAESRPSDQSFSAQQISHAEIQKKRMEDLLREQKAREEEVKRLTQVSLALANELKASSASPPKMGDLPGHAQQRPLGDSPQIQTQNPVQHIGARALFAGTEDRQQHAIMAQKESGQMGSISGQDPSVIGAVEVAQLDEVCVCASGVCVYVYACVVQYMYVYVCIVQYMYMYACIVQYMYMYACLVQYMCVSAQYMVVFKLFGACLICMWV